MPKTDKQKRHEKRLKSIERMERRDARRAREAGDDGELKVTPMTENEGDDDVSLDGVNKKKRKLSEVEKQRQSEARALIKAGMGNAIGGGGGKDT